MIAAAGTACSCELVEPIGKSQPAVSHHTKVLAEAGLIVGEKAGRWVNWAVVPDQLEHLRAALTSSFRPEARLRGRVRVAEEASAPPPSVRLW